MTDPRVPRIRGLALFAAIIVAIVLGVVIAVVGLAVLLAGVAVKLIVIGVIGFVVMGVGVYVATLRTRGGIASGARGTGRTRKSPGFLQGLEEKWERRNRGDRP